MALLPPIVLVDTTSLFNSPSVNTNGWTHLLGRARRNEITLLVSEVTLREELRHTCSKLDEAVGLIERGLGRFTERGFDLDLATIAREHAGRVREQHPKHLRTELERSNVNVLPFPDVSIETLLNRDLAKQKPFNESGKGFRDAVTWESLLEWLSNNVTDSDECDLYLISSDKKDFGNPRSKGKLHDDLLSDLSLHGNVTGHLVSDTQSLHEILKEQFTAIDEQRQRIEDMVVETARVRTMAMTTASASVVENLVGASVRSNSDNQPGAEVSELDLGNALPLSMGHPVIVEVEVEQHGIEFELHDELDGGTAVYSALVPTFFELEGFAHRSDALPDDAPFTWVEPDWDSPVLEVGISVTAVVAVVVITTGHEIVHAYIDYVTDAELRTQTTEVAS